MTMAKKIVFGIIWGLGIVVALSFAVNVILAYTIASNPDDDISRTRLLSGFEQPRARADLRIRELPRALWRVTATCERLYGANDFAVAVWLVFPPQYRGCAVVSPETEECTIVYWASSPDIREHELRHCEGWAHD